MKNRVLQLGFIGGGTNSAVGATHFIASQMDGRFKVSAGCFSRHVAINEGTAKQWNIPRNRLYSDMNQLLELERNRLDAIVVLTPTPYHVEPVLMALRNGHSVICEKALATTSSDVMKIQAAQRELAGFLAVTYNYTGYPMLRELKRMIQQERLGRVEQIHIEMPQEGFARVDRDGVPVAPQQWRLRDRTVPTLALDLGVHIHHIVGFLTEEKPVELVASQSSQGRFCQVVDNTICIAQYTNALECNIWFSKAALGYRNGLRVRVFGEVGSAEWHQMDSEFLIFHDNRGRKCIIDRANVDVELAEKSRYNRFKSGHPAGFMEAFANLYCDLADSLEKYQQGVERKSDYVFGTSHAMEGLLMLEAMTRSSKERCWTQVNSQR